MAISQTTVVHARPGHSTREKAFQGVTLLSDAGRKTLLAGLPNYPESREVALAMWKLCPNLARGSAVTAEHIHSYRVTRTSNVVVVAHENDFPFPNQNKFVVYPRPEHFPMFVLALNSVRPGSYGELNPGSIGTLRTSSFRDIVFDIQAHYRTINPYNSDSLPRKYSTLYGGWRIHVIEEFLRMGISLGSQPFEFSSNLFVHSELHNIAILRDIVSVLSRFGMSHSTDGSRVERVQEIPDSQLMFV
ncbi:MAG: hypothetical protein ABII22_01570 [Candidatus Micrarchaeota archaeon]